MKPTPELRRQIDELGAIDAELGQLEAKHGIAAKEKRATALRKAIAEACGLKPEESAKLDGGAYSAMIGEQQNESTVNKPAVFKLIGKAAFVTASGFTLTALKEYVPDEIERTKYYTVARTGRRAVKTYKLAA
jgi:hypothetical protein